MPAELRLSVSWDRGIDLAHHRQLTLVTRMSVYFCDPQSPWQRGVNELTNVLFGQYFPDGADLRAFSRSALNRTARELDQRLRKTLGFQIFADAVFAPIALTD